MKIFLDTNIVLDFLNADRVKHKISVRLIETLVSNNYQIIISEDMLSTIFYLSKNKQQTLSNLNVIQQEWYISVFGEEVIKNAIDLSITNNLDLEDTLQCLCAKQNNCDALITSDKYFYDCGIKIQTADEFLNA
ncbi:MAG: PIN domain-containing protein [Candidatus Thioglobus sp.]|nr:PIN domain-containing protein [Candidatus Thioglobus pontius]MBL6985273.1 PIN domain-containing protein [Candidatus Thioglobus sp.]